MSDYETKDNTGALFQANNIRVVRQGNAKVAGNGYDIIVTESKTKDGRTLYDTYVKVGPFFTNKYKEEGDDKPDTKTKIRLSGEEFEMAGWKKVSKRGTQFLSLAFREPRASGQSQNGPARAAPLDTPSIDNNVSDDDIPW